MNQVLNDLFEKRDAAQKRFEEFISPLIEAGALTDEQATQKTELRSAVEALDERIDEVVAEEKRKAELAEVRKPLTPAADAKVTNEPTTYGLNSPHSLALDLAKAASPAFRGHREALRRLVAAEHEFAVELDNASPEKRRQMESLVLQEHRSGSDEYAARDALKEVQRRAASGRIGAESRAMDTTASSGGSFATPVYFVNMYAPWVEFGRAFIDQCAKHDLPEYGMTVYMPQVTGPAGVAQQSTQNTQIQETDPTAGYLSSGLITEAGEVTLSQQIIDRAGPGFSFDQMVFDQLRRDYNQKIDTYIINQVLGNANVGAVTYTGTFALTAANGGSSFRTKIGNAKANTISTAGTVTTATHLYLTGNRWEFIDAYTDGQGRPLMTSNEAGPFNTVGSAANNDPIVEGFTGWKVAGLRTFVDSSIPFLGTTTSDQAIVGRMDECHVWEGDPVTRTVPQTLANQLSVKLQLFNYATAIVRYPKAFQVISGTGLSAPTW